MKKLSMLIAVEVLFCLLLSPVLENIVQGQGPSTPPVPVNPPQPKGKFRRVQNKIPNQYIVVFNQTTPISEISVIAADLIRAHGGNLKDTYRHALKGFSIVVPEVAARAISNDPRVEYVEEDGRVSLSTTQTNARWGLDRIDQRNLPLDTTLYLYQQRHRS